MWVAVRAMCLQKYLEGYILRKSNVSCLTVLSLPKCYTQQFCDFHWFFYKKKLYNVQNSSSFGVHYRQSSESLYARCFNDFYKRLINRSRIPHKSVENRGTPDSHSGEAKTKGRTTEIPKHDRTNWDPNSLIKLPNKYTFVRRGPLQITHFHCRPIERGKKDIRPIFLHWAKCLGAFWPFN